MILLSLLAAAVFIDYRKSIIPNKIILLILVNQVIAVKVSCSYQDAADRLYRYLTRCITITILLFLLYVFFSIGAIGAGDLKLLAVTAVGFEQPAYLFALTFSIAAVMSLIHAIRNEVLFRRIRYLIEYCKDICESGSIKRYSDEDAKIESRKKYSIHLSLPVLLAAIFIIYKFRL